MQRRKLSPLSLLPIAHSFSIKMANVVGNSLTFTRTCFTNGQGLMGKAKPVQNIPFTGSVLSASGFLLYPLVAEGMRQPWSLQLPGE